MANQTKPRRSYTITPIAVAFELHCPNKAPQPKTDFAGCQRENPIPAPDGSFMWTELPYSVQCPDCGVWFKIGKRVVV